MRARRVVGLDPEAPLRSNASRIVGARLEELRVLAAEALEPSAAGAQHDLRIAAKRLRYVLELVGPCFGDEAEAARRAAAELQGILGDIHDCDVLLPRARGIESLEALLRTRRERRFRRFLDLWRRDDEKGVWSALERRLGR